MQWNTTVCNFPVSYGILKVSCLACCFFIWILCCHNGSELCNFHAGRRWREGVGWAVTVLLHHWSCKEVGWSSLAALCTESKALGILLHQRTKGSDTNIFPLPKLKQFSFLSLNSVFRLWVVTGGKPPNTGKFTSVQINTRNVRCISI